ncbi:Odorant receptor 391, partial [Nylanderia fulva]
ATVLLLLRWHQMKSINKKIAYSAYDNQWYDFDVKIMKNLPLVIFREMIPHQITTGKCLPMNLFSFKEILKAIGFYLF